MTEKLNDLIERAARVPFSPADKEAQRRSFAYGNAQIENKWVTREMIDEAASRIAKPE